MCMGIYIIYIRVWSYTYMYAIIRIKSEREWRNTGRVGERKG